MPITCEEGEHQCVVRLEGELDVACSAELKRCFVEAISHQRDLALDLNAATDLDVTALQLLWAAIQASEKAGKALNLVSELPENIRTAIREAGFEPLLAPLISPQAERNLAAASEAADD